MPLRYHVGADLVRAAATRWAGVAPYALLNRLEPVLWALALMAVLAALALRLGGSALAAALAAWSVLACDFSFAWAAPRHVDTAMKVARRVSRVRTERAEQELPRRAARIRKRSGRGVSA